MLYSPTANQTLSEKKYKKEQNFFSAISYLIKSVVEITVMIQGALGSILFLLFFSLM